MHQATYIIGIAARSGKNVDNKTLVEMKGKTNQINLSNRQQFIRGYRQAEGTVTKGGGCRQVDHDGGRAEGRTALE